MLSSFPEINTLCNVAFVGCISEYTYDARTPKPSIYSLDIVLSSLLKEEAYDHIQKNPKMGYILSIFEPVLP